MFPNVPHVVGDDDDLGQTNDEQELLNANSNCDPNSRDDIAKTSDSETSDSSESSNEDQNEAEGNNSHYDTTEEPVEDEEEQVEDQNEQEKQDANDGEGNDEDEDEGEEEEEDWSNHISYIDRTPERGFAEVSSSKEVFGIPTNFIEDYPTEDGSVEYLKEDVHPENAYAHSLIDGFKNNADLEPMEVNTNTPPIKIDDLESLSNQPVEVQPNGVELQTSGEVESKVEEKSVRKPKTSGKAAQSRDTANPTMEESSAESRRKSLRSACRPAAPIESLPAAKKKRLRRRTLKAKDFSLPPPTTTATASGAQSAAKRTRRVPVVNRSIMQVQKKSGMQLVRPIVVTDYFTQVSATLVSERVNLLPFLHLRAQVDRLVAEALAKSKIQRK
ncbi:histone H3.v1 [Drosophila grimshawi]|nr:histone H3.v1 [Drosophila grimshawi]